MIRRIAVILCLLGSIALEAQQPAPAAAPRATVPRAIRRDVPLTNAIRRAYEAGTRDATGRPGPNYWQLQTDYTIAARLDPATQTITGTETIALHNNSPQALTEILLRLDHNIFRGLVPRGTVGPGGKHRRHGRHRRSPSTARAVDLAPAPPAGGGGRGGGGGGSRRRAGSPRPDSIRRWRASRWRRRSRRRPPPRLEIAWRTKLPGGPDGRGHRMTQRIDDTLFQPTQWFPRIAKYDDLRGWDTSLYLGPAEFYNNFGRFDVKHRRARADGSSAAPACCRTRRRCSRRRRASGSRTCSTPTTSSPSSAKTRVGPGPVDRARRPAGVALRRRHGERLRLGDGEELRLAGDARHDPGQGTGPDPHGLRAERTPTSTPTPGRSRGTRSSSTRSCGRRIAFPQLTLQDGPSSGMEYPMVINSNQGAADHETGHQWWPMMVGNNETWYGWMDEGFNQYMNILSGADSRKRRAGPRRPRPELRPDQRRRERGADDVGREQRRAACTASRPTRRRRSCSRCSAASSATPRSSAR